jgi:hypothetical protein
MSERIHGKFGVLPSERALEMSGPYRKGDVVERVIEN